MGLKGILKGMHPWLRKKRGYNPTLRHPMHHHLPDDPINRVDVLSFFNNIRWIYTRHADDKTMAHAILFEHIKKYGNPSRMVFYVDGALLSRRRRLTASETRSESRPSRPPRLPSRRSATASIKASRPPSSCSRMSKRISVEDSSDPSEIGRSPSIFYRVNSSTRACAEPRPTLTSLQSANPKTLFYLKARTSSLMVQS